MADGVDGVLREVSMAVLAVSRQLSVREALQVIVRSARSLLDARYAAIGVPDTDGGFAEFVVDGISDRQWRAIGTLPRQHGVLDAMMNRGRSYRTADIRTDPGFVGNWPAAHPAMRDFLGVPITDGDQVLGTIYLANKTRTADRAGGFTAEDQELATLFAGHAAIALTNAGRYERERELTVVRERTRLARELHDAVAQKLFGIRLAAGTAAALAERDDRDTGRAAGGGRLAGELARLQRLAGEALDELRAVIVELRPAQLDDDGLMESLRKHVVVLDRVHEAEVRFDGGEDCACALAAEAEVVVYRVVQEALHNALRHARAGHVDVRLRRAGTALTAEVADDGVGFDTSRPAHGVGITSMRERAALIDGELSVRSVAGAGTTVRLSVPCASGAGDTMAGDGDG